MKQTELEIHSSGATESAARLTEPHFDDTTVASAVPVEPLPNPPKRSWFRLNAARLQHLSGTAWIAVAAIIFGAVAIALSVATVRTPASEPSEPAAAIKPLQQSTESEAADGSIVPSERPRVQRSLPREGRKLKINSSKPVARKVGTIYDR